MLDRTTTYNHLNTRWDDEKEDRLRELWAEGASYTAIGVELRFSRSAIAGKVNRLGLDKRKDKDRGKRAPYTTMRRKAIYFAANVKQPKLSKPVIPKPDASIVPAEFRGLTFAQLEPWHCRYPRGEKAPYLYCGAPIERDSYCGHCFNITHWIVPASVADNAYWWTK